MIKSFPHKYALYIFLLIYSIVNIQTLMIFPNIHSDELWLLGLTDQMIQEKTVFTTESFYDLYPRVEHPFRWVYHLIYSVFVLVFGSNVFAGRLVSLVPGIGVLWIFHKWLTTKYHNAHATLIATIFLSLNINFLSSSHTGRQETWILFLMVLLIYWIDQKKFSPLVYAAIIAIGIGVHPNSFIIGVTAAALLFAQWIIKERSFKDLLLLILYTSLFAAVYVFLGFMNDPNFLTDYMKFGSELGVDAAPLSRIEGFYWFWYKLYHGIGGTYDLFDIRINLIFTAGMTFLAILNRKNKTLFKMLAVISGILLALFLIGRYNQTSVLFVIPWSIPMLMEVSKKHLFPVMAGSLIIACGLLIHNISTYYQDMPYYKSYEEILTETSAYLDDESIVLGNLNMIEAGGTSFYDYRNLGYLEGSFESYINERNIDTILLHEEMEYLYNTSPKWDFLYVSIDYYPEMQTFLESKCTLVATLENPVYAMRITKYTGTYPWTTKIYKVKKSEER